MKRILQYIFLFTSISSYAQSFEMDTILYSGPIDNRINIVMLGDGYQTNELDKFIIDANQITNDLFNKSPYREYKDFFNVISIKVPSNESGASHPGTATDVTEPQHPVSIVDNYFGSSFDAFGIHRLLTVNNFSNIFNVLATNFPSYDQVLVIVNSPHYGGSGGNIATCSTHPEASEIAIHEIGHSFADLADEYYAGDSFSQERKNMTSVSNPNDVRWKNWVGSNGIDVYQHCCDGNSANWYKPNTECLMQSLNRELCSVCAEGTLETIHSFTNLIDSYSPDNNDYLDATSELNFNAELLTPIPNSLNVEWKLNETLLTETSSNIFLDPNQLINGDNELLVTVTDESSFLRVDNYELVEFASVIWNIDGNTTSIKEITSQNTSLRLFPNPVEDVFMFKFESEIDQDYAISISDSKGQVISTRKFDSSELEGEFDLSRKVPGIYFLRIQFENGIEFTKKLVKK